MVEINEIGKKEKGIKRNEDNLRDLWDNVKRLNIPIIGVPEEVWTEVCNIVQEVVIKTIPPKKEMQKGKMVV